MPDFHENDDEDDENTNDPFEGSDEDHDHWPEPSTLTPGQYINNPLLKTIKPGQKMGWGTFISYLQNCKCDHKGWTLYLDTFIAEEKANITTAVNSKTPQILPFRYWHTTPVFIEVGETMAKFMAAIPVRVQSMIDDYTSNKEKHMENGRIMFGVRPYAMHKWDNKFLNLDAYSKVVDFRSGQPKIFINGNNKNIEKVIPKPEEAAKMKDIQAAAIKALKPAKESSF